MYRNLTILLFLQLRSCSRNWSTFLTHSFNPASFCRNWGTSLVGTSTIAASKPSCLPIPPACSLACLKARAKSLKRKERVRWNGNANNEKGVNLLPASLLLLIPHHGHHERLGRLRVLHEKHECLFLCFWALAVVQFEDEWAQFLQSKRKLKYGRVLEEVILNNHISEVTLWFDFTAVEETLPHSHDRLLQVLREFNTADKVRPSLLLIQGVVGGPEIGVEACV